MRLGNKPLGFLINFLLGVAWASVFLAAVTSFLIFYEETFFYALVSAFIAALPGIVSILAIEYFITSKEKLEELKKQTKLLEKIIHK
ncbi:MAG TPA: hypothetical protein EYG82_02830 [Sulfurovum sp.]|nr:hypothetical protein [Sulfurovum sp.]